MLRWFYVIRTCIQSLLTRRAVEEQLSAVEGRLGAAELTDPALDQLPAGDPAVYLLTEPASRYYRIMTREEWMPCLVGETI